MNLKLGFDLDGVLANFEQGLIDRGKELNLWKKHYPQSHEDWNSWNPIPKTTFNKIWKTIESDESFWLNLEPLTNLRDFRVDAYITARSVSSEISRKWLKKNGFPEAEVITTGFHKSKISAIESLGLDFFLDDKPVNFHEINSGTISHCFLLERPWNSNIYLGKIGEGQRLHSIEDYLREVETEEELQRHLDEITKDILSRELV